MYILYNGFAAHGLKSLIQHPLKKLVGGPGINHQPLGHTHVLHTHIHTGIYVKYFVTVKTGSLTHCED